MSDPSNDWRKWHPPVYVAAVDLLSAYCRSWLKVQRALDSYIMAVVHEQESEAKKGDLSEAWASHCAQDFARKADDLAKELATSAPADASVPTEILAELKRRISSDDGWYEFITAHAARILRFRR